jgi:nucleotide-binding universal stress UspA family protein
MSMVDVEPDSVSINRILVPVDGSPTSIKAANYAIYLAKTAKAELAVVNIIEDVKQGGAIGLQAKYGNVSLVEAFKKVRTESAQEWLNQIEDAAKKNGVKVKIEILDGEGQNEAKLITEYTKKNDIELIIIGSKGRSGIKGLWIGGFTNSVIHHSTCPVLVVP